MKPSEEARAGLRLPVTGVSSSGRPRGRSISGRRVPEARRAGPGRAPRPAERAAHGLLGGPRMRWDGRSALRESRPPHPQPRGQHRPGISAGGEPGLPQPGRRRKLRAARGCPRRTPRARPPSLPAGPPAPAGFPAPGLAQDCGQRGRGVRHAAQVEGCSQEAGWRPAPPNLTKVSVYRGAPSLDLPCTHLIPRPQGRRWRPGRSASRERKMLCADRPVERPPFTLQSLRAQGTRSLSTTLPPAGKLCAFDWLLVLKILYERVPGPLKSRMGVQTASWCLRPQPLLAQHQLQVRWGQRGWSGAVPSPRVCVP